MVRADRLGVIDYLIRSSSEKGATIKIVCPLAKENSEIVKRISEKAPDIKIMNGGSSHSGLFVVDSAKFLRFELKEPTAEEFSDAIGFIVYSNSKIGVNSSKSFFELLWNEHIQYERIKEYEKQKETDNMKNEFINVAAHELRTPIQPVLGLCQLLRSKTINAEFDEFLDIIIRNAKRLQHLADGILDVTRFESYSLKLDKVQFNLNDLILNVIANMKTQIVNDKVKLLSYRTSQDIFVEADKERISQLISNLLSNAIKFTEEGTVCISTEFKDNSKKEVLVTIKDTGQGIYPGILPRLFSKFVSKSFQGTGLGLFIAKSIVEAHEGRIWGENNTDGKGATFIFSLPISRELDK